MLVRRASLVGNLFLGTAAVCVTAAFCRGETMVLESVADTSLWELNPSFNFGAQSDVPSGTLGPMAGLAKSRLLVKFDLAELPSGVVIDGATLRLSVVISPSGRANSVFEMRRVVFDWGEGNKKGAEPGGAEATAGEATWEHRLHPSTEWDDPGGDIGTDFAQDSSAEATVFDLGTYEFEFNAAGIADLVAMLADSDQNFGWAIISRSEGTAKTARRWATRENSQLSLRPQLEIQYSNLVPPPEPEIRSTELGSSSISIRILALGGVQYSLERGESVNGEPWTVVAELGVEEASRDAEFVVPRGIEPRQFFRVVATFPSVIGE